MRIHLIAIGGAVMHNLAIILQEKGHIVSGSDDEIFEPSKTRLEKSGLLPLEMGWDARRLSTDIDAVILGMHAKENNPELAEARRLGLVIKSFPEFLYEQTRNKLRIVVGGSHGKTTITSMIMHVLKSRGMKFDYMVGSMIDGFNNMVGLDDNAEIAVFEGDEYLTSILDRRPKFHLYKPDIAVISGIAWDHINVFPKFDTYVDQFKIFVDKITPTGTLVYNEDDGYVKTIATGARKDIKQVPYKVQEYSNGPEGCVISHNNRKYLLEIFGKHNMLNLSAAREVCALLGIPTNDFLESASTFQGSAKRLQLIKEENRSAFYLDFAHAPSKVRASVGALAERYPEHKKVCCIELHTYSSLNPDFLKEYKDCLADADFGFIYFNPYVLKLKNLAPLSGEHIARVFGDGVTGVFYNTLDLLTAVKEINSGRIVYLFMSSGDFNGTDFNKLSESLIKASDN